MQRSFFDITSDELGLLGAGPAVDVLREMVMAEMGNLGIPITEADVPFSITTADGGVDAVVHRAPKSEGNGLIFAPRTSYQVKAGDFALSPTTPGQIESLLMKPSACTRRTQAKPKMEPSGKAHSVDDISPRVRTCLDAGGTFVVLLFGSDTIDEKEGATEDAVRAFLADIDAKYKEAKIKVWRASRIAMLLRRFPAISLQIKNLNGFQLLAHPRWAERPEMRQPYRTAPEQEAAIKTLHQAIRDDTRGTVHIRVLGEPGIGKTRLILEALRPDDIRPNVIYADKGSKIDGFVVNAINNVKDARIVLVVDECGPDQRSQMGRDFGDERSNLTILSIYQDETEGDRSRDYRLLAVPVLPIEEIETIIKSYDVEAVKAKGWAEMCDGSPRVAHVVGQNLKDHPEDPLKSDGATMIWVRFLADQDDKDSETYRRRHLVMSSLALFKRFGWGHAVRRAGFEIYDLIVSKLDGGISRAQFGAIIDQMVFRKVLQGDNFLYITPRALQLKLWVDWWKANGATINMNDVIPQLSRDMRQWFGEMLEYANATPIAKQEVAKLLGPNGLYANADWLCTREGGRFFFSLCRAAPVNALRALERTVGKMTKAELLDFTDGRREIIPALELIALRAELFRPAAKLTLALAEAENETWSNNATGIFAGLFSLGYGEIAPTGLEPEKRLPVLLDALKQSDERIRIALRAFDTALETQSITRWGEDEPFRLGEPIKRWTPKTYGELFAAYKAYWSALRGALTHLPAKYKAQATHILLSRMREMLRIQDMHGEVLDTIDQFSRDPDVDNRDIIEKVSNILQYDRSGLPNELAEKLESVIDSLIGQGFGSRLRRYAGMDLLEDRLDSNGNEIDKTARDLASLADEAIDSPDKLEAELNWLVTDEARNGFRYAYALGKKDTECASWPPIVSAWRKASENRSDYFVGGYLRAVFERDPAKWDAIIAEFSQTDSDAAYVPGLVWRSGMTERAAHLILGLAKVGKIKPRQLRLFSMGRTSAPISDATFGEWLVFLTGLNDFEPASTALDLAAMTMHGGRKLSPAQIKSVLEQPALFKSHNDRNDVMLTHYWLQLARALIKAEPSSEVDVLRAVVVNIGNASAVTARLGPDGERCIDGLVARHPKEAWQIVSELIQPPMDARGLSLTRWLRGDQGFSGSKPGPMRHIFGEDVWEWIKNDPEPRAALVASMAIKDFRLATWKNSLIREILCKYGDSEKVQSAAYSNFFTGGWSGPESAHYAQQVAELDEIRQWETEPNAIRWLNGAIDSLKGQLEQAKIGEEARGY